MQTVIDNVEPTRLGAEEGPPSLEQQVKVDLAKRILTRASALVYVAITRRVAESDFCSVAEWVRAGRDDLALEGVSKRSLNQAMPFALAVVEKLLDHEPKRPAAFRLLVHAAELPHWSRTAKVPKPKREEPDTLVLTRGLGRDLITAGIRAIEITEADEKAIADAQAASMTSVAWDLQFHRKLRQPTPVGIDVDAAAAEQLTALDRDLQLHHFPPLRIHHPAFRAVELPLEGPNEVLLALHPVIPGRYRVVRSTTKAIDLGAWLDGHDQQRLDRWLVKGGKAFVCRPGVDYALNAVCQRHPWGATPENLTLVDPLNGRTLASFLVGSERYNWGAKLVGGRLPQDTPGKQAAAREFRQVGSCPICLLPVENAVLAANRVAVSRYRRERVAATMMIKKAGGEKVSRAEIVHAKVVRAGETVALGHEPALQIVGTVYRVEHDAGAEWWRSAAAFMKAAGKGQYPKGGDWDRRQAWIEEAERNLRRPRDPLTFEIEGPSADYEMSPRVMGDPERSAEDEEREAQALIVHLQRAR